MSKRFIIVAAAIVVMGAGLAAYLSYISQEYHRGASPLSKAELAAKYAEVAYQFGQTNVATEAVLTPIALSHPVRLAIGGLGLTNNDQNQQLGDLVTVQLTGTPGFELVERQKLAAILQELNLSLNRFVRAKDAVRAGKLLRADWFLLGTAAKIDGTNSLVVRVVDAHTGIMRDAGVFPADQPPTELAADLAGFLRQSRQDAASAKLRVYLAVGAFEDLSVNNRRADFPAQLSGYLTAAYRGSRVTLLERDYVETLLQEVRLDLAGLTESNGTNPPAAMQSAFWLVSGQYQSYETTNFQVEVNLDIQQVFGRFWHRTLRGLPGDAIGQQVKSAIDDIMRQNASSITPTRNSEVRIQMSIGRELSGLHRIAVSGDHDFQLVWLDVDWDMDPQLVVKKKRKVEDAMRAFETVLLLEPTNRLAKMYLAACLREPVIYRLDEARSVYREIIDEVVQDKWTGLAEKALGMTFLNPHGNYDENPDETRRWYESAAAQTTNAIVAAFYRQQAEAAATEATINAHDGLQSEELAEQRLFDGIQASKDTIQNGSGKDCGYFVYEYVKTFDPDRATAAHKLVELLPKMIQQAPELEPYILAAVLSYQVDTNSPVVAEFERMLNNCIQHPRNVIKPSVFWGEISLTAYDWCFEKTNYPLAIKILEGERRVALEVKLDFDDQEKIKLAYAYLAVERWRDALDIFESFTNRLVQADWNGPWGEARKPILPDKMADFCRQKLGLAITQNPRKFDIGKPLMCLCSPSTFIADDNGLWVGIGGQLLHLDFAMQTNLVVRLPMDESMPVTTICPVSSKIWIGTRGGGLIEYDKASRQCRQLTVTDGLMMDDISSLAVDEDSLWIGYGGATGGGLGQLDLRSQKLKSFMPSLNANSTAGAGEAAPRNGIADIVAGPDGDLWLSDGGVIRQFHVARGVWETLHNQAGDWVSCFSADSTHLVEGGGIQLFEIETETKPYLTAPTNEIKKTTMVVSLADISRLEASFKNNGNLQRIVGFLGSGEIVPKGGLAFQNLRDHHWQTLEDAEAIPNPPSTMTLDGNNLWVGGEGFIALVDLTNGKVRKFCHIQANRVDRIQIAGGYLWAQFDWHLYRVPLSTLQ